MLVELHFQRLLVLLHVEVSALFISIAEDLLHSFRIHQTIAILDKLPVRWIATGLAVELLCELVGIVLLDCPGGLLSGFE